MNARIFLNMMAFTILEMVPGETITPDFVILRSGIPFPPRTIISHAHSYRDWGAQDHS